MCAPLSQSDDMPTVCLEDVYDFRTRLIGAVDALFEATCRIGFDGATSASFGERGRHTANKRRADFENALVEFRAGCNAACGGANLPIHVGEMDFAGTFAAALDRNDAKAAQEARSPLQIAMGRVDAHEASTAALPATMAYQNSFASPGAL